MPAQHNRKTTEDTPPDADLHGFQRLPRDTATGARRPSSQPPDAIPVSMQLLMIHCLLVTLLGAALGDSEPTVTSIQSSPEDYVYPSYALQYLGLGEYTQQSSTNDNSPVVYTGPDQQGYAKYTTYTTDGSKVFQTTVRVKPGTYPVIWSTPVNSKPPNSDTKSTNDASSGHSLASVGNSDNHPSEDALPMMLPIESQKGLPETSLSSSKDLPEDSTVHTSSGHTVASAAVVESQDEDQRAGEDKEVAHGGSNKGISEESNSLNENHNSAAADIKGMSRYYPSRYGTISFYPITYNPFFGQKNLIAKPISTQANGKLSSILPSAPGQGDRIAETTLKPLLVSMTSTNRPSSIPGSITTAGSPVRTQPISYFYPYMSYQAKNSGVVYQMPTQQINKSPQYVAWVQTQPRYQATYPQGFLSYQPTVLALRSALPSNHNAQPKVSSSPTVHTTDMVGKQ